VAYSCRATRSESFPEKTTRRCSTRGCSVTNAYAMSHICGTDGGSAAQEIVRYGDLRARAQELLSPVGGTALSPKDAASLKDSVLLCKT
jgi:hypothetical protein